MKNFYAFFILILLFYIFVIQAAPIFAESNFITGLKTTGGNTGAGYPDVGTGTSGPMNFLAKMLGQAVTPIFMGVTGMLSLAYGGYKWMMARGNEQEVELAKTIIFNTLIAMLVAFSAYAILALVVDKIVDPTFNLY